MSKRATSDKPVTKLEVATDHVTAALILIANEASPYSTHLLAMAADEIILAVARNSGRQLEYDPEILIKPEKLGEYRMLMRRAYNYAKHADRDHADAFVPSETQNLASANDLLTFLNVCGLSRLGVKLPQHFLGFLLLLGNWKPDLVKWKELENEYPALAGKRAKLPPMDRDLYILALRSELRRSGVMPG